MSNNTAMIPGSHSVAGMSEASSLIPGAPEVEEYAAAMRNAGISHSDLVKAQQHSTAQQVTSATKCEEGASVVLNTEARGASNISPAAIEKARREVVKATNAIQSRFVLGIVPSVRLGDDDA